MKFEHKYIVEDKVGPKTIINGKEYLYFAGTGYFNLSAHPELIDASINASRKFGMLSSTSRALTGTTTLIVELENKIAEFFATQDAAYLPSGYLSNIAGLNALKTYKPYDIIFIDEGSHYSNIEGAATVGKQIVKFKNLSAASLEEKINKHLKPGQKPLIASDGLFPIWAATPPLSEYLKIAEKYDGILWVDDAHAVGILGKNGRGTYEHLGLVSDRIFMGATLSKAFGAYGGFICGDAEFIKHVKEGSVLTGSSSPLSAAAAAAIAGIEIVKNNPELRKKLWGNANYLKQSLRRIGIKTDDSKLPIATFVPDKSTDMLRIHSKLMEKGIYIQHAKYKGSGSEGVLRIVVFSSHSKEQIDFLAESLKELL